MTEKEIYLQTFNNMDWSKFTIKELKAMPSKVDCVFPFGRYKGELVSDVYEIAPHYLKWVIENCPNISDDLLQAIEYHLVS